VTFRTRLLLASLLTLAVGLGALLVAGNVLLAARTTSERSSLLHAQAQAQIAALDAGPRGVRVRETANDAVMDRRAWVLDRGRVLERPAGVPAALDRAAVALGRRGRAAERGGPNDEYLLAQPVRVRRHGPVVGAVVVARSGDPVETLQKMVLFGSMAIALLILLAAAVAIRNAIDGALRPVAAMTEQAADWSEHDLDRRFALGAPRDEITGLAATLDRMLGRIAASRRHEQRFASEVAHELRTPIAGLRGRAELAMTATGPGADAERRDALETVVEQVDRVQEAVDTLLSVARREHDGTAGAVDVAAVVDDYRDVERVVPEGLPPAEGEEELIRRALTPLVENARRHARERVTIEVSAVDDSVVIAVCDDGEGVAPAEAEQLFEPGVRSDRSDGAGLGLALSRRLARSCGGDAVADPGADGGRFLLILRAGE
jgi:signal transduction histidine kinase